MLAQEVHAEAHSNIPLLVSIAVSLGGLLLGWLVYRKYHNAEARDPLQKSLGGVFTFLQNKYKVDEFYQAVFINPSLWFADKVVYQFFDHKLIDGALHGLAAIGVWLGNLLRNKFDVPVVNGAGDGLARTTRDTGGLLHRQQSGKVQQYLAIAIGTTVVAGLIILLLVISV
jgi:NADH-quinone oxidoreductase subunit L